ncbi:hypothetical protein [Pseudomonas amygdali]|uniref:hypothetical protein n=1 Tax=Pseudomonas amygdali TaxID=47877 RepID=UPI000C0B1C32|nr:hypothetical protein [Pseudomonas amygdali]PHN48796.1 hypothetical protein AO277_18590 [Pseudomonas amygdali]
MLGISKADRSVIAAIGTLTSISEIITNVIDQAQGNNRAEAFCQMVINLTGDACAAQLICSGGI